MRYTRYLVFFMKPRVVIRCEWMEKGVDTGVMMPYLSRYLGHSSISETQYYYHTIEQAFPIIRRQDAVPQRIIPEVVAYEE